MRGQICESRFRRGEGNRPQETPEPLQNELFRKILAPNSQVSLIGHDEHYNVCASQPEIAPSASVALVESDGPTHRLDQFRGIVPNAILEHNFSLLDIRDVL